MIRLKGLRAHQVVLTAIIPATVCRVAMSLFWISALMSPLARAGSGSSFLETIGVSTAVGAVLGASTLPFYDQPQSHLVNIAYGASIGAVVGVGILVYGLFEGSKDKDQQHVSDRTQLRWGRGLSFVAPGSSSREIAMPLVSLTW